MISNFGTYESAELALAAYAVLDRGIIDPNQVTALENAGMSLKQAQEFAARYPEVITQFVSEETGFSATVFMDVEGKLHLAFRGTEGLDIPDLSTDTDIWLHGAGYDQIVDMYNWWQRVSAEPGTLVPQFNIAMETSVPPGATAFYSEPAGSDGHPLYTYLESASPVEATSIAEGNLHAELKASGGLLDVTGHSLGGHLAIAFNALFPTVSADIPTFNAPGFVDNGNNQGWTHLREEPVTPKMRTGTRLRRHIVAARAKDDQTDLYPDLLPGKNRHSFHYAEDVP